MSNTGKEISAEGKHRDPGWPTQRQTHKHNECYYLFSIHSAPLTHFAEDLRHLKRARGVHVGSDDGDASVGLFGVAECEGPLKVHLREEGGGGRDMSNSGRRVSWTLLIAY